MLLRPTDFFLYRRTTVSNVSGLFVVVVFSFCVCVWGGGGFYWGFLVVVVYVLTVDGSLTAPTLLNAYHNLI